MSRELIPFLVFAIFLGLIFCWPRNDWRVDQQQYLSSRLKGKVVAGEKASTLDTTGLGSLYELFAKGAFSTRIDRLAGSLLILRKELEGYRELLLAAREAVRAGQWEEDDRFANRYFPAANKFSRLESRVLSLSARVDSLQSGIRPVKPAKGNRASGSGDEARINWLIPLRVPVREACTSCHRVLEGGERVMLYKEDAPPWRYPKVMLEHPVLEFGCTVCHRGGTQELDFKDAHGTDRRGMSFRAGKLARRSCGLCHAGRSPLKNARVPFLWPQSCHECHADDKLATVVDSSSSVFHTFPMDERVLRSWLLKHWGEKVGRIPDRDNFEQAATLLVSGETHRSGTQVPDSAGPRTQLEGWNEVRALRCPLCGRSFRVAPGQEGTACPVDGTVLVP